MNITKFSHANYNLFVHHPKIKFVFRIWLQQMTTSTYFIFIIKIFHKIKKSKKATWSISQSYSHFFIYFSSVLFPLNPKKLFQIPRTVPTCISRPPLRLYFTFQTSHLSESSFISAPNSFIQSCKPCKPCRTHDPCNLCGKWLAF